jgi:hypothetical protein
LPFVVFAFFEEFAVLLIEMLVVLEAVDDALACCLYEAFLLVGV